jgi:hypothetical protein
LILQVHDGGWVSGSNESATNDFFYRQIMKLCDVIVVAVGYRLAPENRFSVAWVAEPPPRPRPALGVVEPPPMAKMGWSATHIIFNFLILIFSFLGFSFINFYF